MIVVLFIWGFVLEGFGAAINVAKPKKGSTVAVFGLGAVGLAVSFSFVLFDLKNKIDSVIVASFFFFLLL